MSPGSSGKLGHADSCFQEKSSLYFSIKLICVMQVPSRLLQGEPAEDGANLGGEGDEEPAEVQMCVQIDHVPGVG